ncbi:transposase [Lewinella sp. LCG006]|uniref:transposase n=1 Tax=Lewinella sp. LCG006 TaxID=3231911 RepID=UPI0034613CFD
MKHQIQNNQTTAAIRQDGPNLPIIMAYNPQKHRRRSIRLKGYDYSQAGLYFITICTQNRACLFGEIIDGEMILNDAGKMIAKWYDELENKFPDIRCHEMITMPNHFHCIIENVGPPVGADLRVCPNTITDGNNGITDDNTLDEQILGEQTLGEHIGSPLHRVVQWFKTMTTNEYIRGVKTLGWQPFNGKLWQRNYWEHIIRNENTYHRIAAYIINNPKKWDDDKLKSQ